MLAFLGEAVHAAMAGTGQAVVLRGEPGIGKTALLTAAAEDAAIRGARVLWGNCWDGEGSPGFRPWIQILRAYMQEATPSRQAAELGPATPRRQGGQE